METKRDLSISMAQANLIVLFLSIPVVIAQFALFILLHGTAGLQPTGNLAALAAAVLVGVAIHELIHGLSWVFFGNKSWRAVRFGFQWKTLTPYAHLTEPVEINAYRWGGFLPGFLLGIVPYLLSLVLANGNLFWFSVAHTSAAGGDWLVLWLLRKVQAGTQVEDHPTRAGCYVLEP